MVLKDEVVVSSYILHDSKKDMPKKLSVSKNSLEYFGQPAVSKAGRFTGIYGTRGKESCNVLASKFAANSEQRQRVHVMDIGLHVPSARTNRQLITRTHLNEGHCWVHMERVALSLRAEIAPKFHDWIEAAEGAKAANKAINERLSLIQMSLIHPYLPIKWLDSDPALKFIIHPVCVAFDVARKYPLFVLTTKGHVRDSCNWAKVRFRDDVVVTV